MFIFIISSISSSATSKGVLEINIKIVSFIASQHFRYLHKFIFLFRLLYPSKQSAVRGKMLALISHKMFAGPKMLGKPCSVEILSIERYRNSVEMFDWFMLVPVVCTRTALLNYCLAAHRKASERERIMLNWNLNRNGISQRFNSRTITITHYWLNQEALKVYVALHCIWTNTSQSSTLELTTIEV